MPWILYIFRVTSFMATSSTYTSPQTGQTYTIVSGGSTSTTSQVVTSGTVVDGAKIVASSTPVSPDWSAIPHYTGVPGSQIIENSAGALNTIISGTSFPGGGAIVSQEHFVFESSTQTIQSGAFASNTTLGPLATSIIENGGISYNVNISGGWLTSGGLMTIQYAQYAATQIVSDGGTLHTATVGITSSSQQPASGTLILSGGSADHITIGSGAVLQKSGTLSDVTVGVKGVLSVSADQNATNVTGNGGTIILDHNANLTGIFKNNAQTTISFTDLGNTASTVSGVLVHNGGSVSPSSGSTLEIMSGGQVLHSIGVADDFSSPYYFQTAPSGNGLDLIVGTPCYCPGTLIATPQGERPVEQLSIGDIVLTALGKHRPIRWIGRRAYDPIFAYGNRDILPILFRAGSLGDGLPRRDLMVSPLHAMLIDGRLIPALHLVNDLSILQIEKPSEIRYIHIELESHDVLLAEGAPSESFLDDNSRGMFHNADEYDDLYPEPSKQPPRYCAPRLEDGPELARIHDRLKQYARNFLPLKAA